MKAQEKQPSTWIAGLDVGQAQDPTALVIIERFLQPVGEPKEKRFEAKYHLRHIERFELGARFSTYEDRTLEVLKSEQMKGDQVLVVDHTGVGARVVESLDEKIAKTKAQLVAVNITAGTKVNYENSVYNVPKRDLVGVVTVFLGDGTLKIAESLELAPLLTKELQNFRVKYTAKGNDTYEAWREGDHDDLVLATALACWYGDRFMAESVEEPGEPNDQFEFIYPRRIVKQ